MGIAGASGSGKSYLSELLRQKIGRSAVAIFPLDAYYFDLSALSDAERALHNFDEPGALEWGRIERDLDHLLSGRPIRLPIYDFGTHTRRSGGVRLDPSAYLIVEGLFALYEPALREKMDLKIFMDVDPGVSDARRIERDTRERGRTLPDSIRQINASVRPMFEKHIAPTRAHADILFSGADPQRQVTDIIRRMTGAGS